LSDWIDLRNFNRDQRIDEILKVLEREHDLGRKAGWNAARKRTLADAAVAAAMTEFYSRRDEDRQAEPFK
jgi:hypothetical protein